MGNQSLSASGVTFLKGHEGLNLKFYADPKGFPTVGYGHLITKSKVYTPNTNLTQAEADALSKSLGLSYTSPITQSQADTFLTKDTASAVAAVNNLVLPSGHKFSQSQFDALVSLTFNAGSGVLATNDVKTMLANAHIYPTFIGPLTQDMLDTCSKMVSKAFSYDRSLQPRRNDEATLFCTGMKYTHKYPVYTL
ncbi:lysozyme [Paenibacillus cineris]|uniref:Lysozyme n=1 Tax=Paenibacillus cineris TaxID=237530 RepID=A0ABQ4LKA7_9BACL|nr:lysozyme [Paenibacillus cineris]GIO56937.1 lysozyme [Paenibacillus cineris]